MTNPDYRAMCSELAEELVNEYGYCTEWEKGLPLCESNVSELLTRARALLAQPEPVAPTDQEIEEWADACPEAPLEEMDPEVHGWRRCFTAKEFGETIRAAIARWGCPTPHPPADGEVAKLVEWLQDCADVRNWEGYISAGHQYFRAAELLKRYALPTPEATHD